ncbi:unnamed protein product [Rhizophagus irregularis]|nr:unnamed protein product [Rhizophagus irregularis]CAB5108064.1 unnamed protein product [Rhizophagus irregularis]CAB5349884.1 unnamed protein product [Rhizophagus irregularis]
MNLRYQSTPDESFQPEINNELQLTNNIHSRLFTSKIHHFKNLPEPRNATKEELEAFYSGNNPNLHSKEQNYLEIPDDTNEL